MLSNDKIKATFWQPNITVQFNDTNALEKKFRVVVLSRGPLQQTHSFPIDINTNAMANIIHKNGSCDQAECDEDEDGGETAPFVTDNVRFKIQAQT